MGLDCIIKWHNGEEFTDNLPKEIIDEFKEFDKFGIIGFDIQKYNGNYYINFRGKAYAYIIQKLTKKSLYRDLESDELESIYMKLDDFIEKNSNLQLEQIQKAYDETWSINDWIYSLTDEYIPSPNEIIGLRKLFEICHENKLQLYASY